MLKRIKITALAALCTLLCTVFTANAALPDSISVFGTENTAVEEKLASPVFTATVSGSTATVKLWGLLPVKNMSLKVLKQNSLYLGGMAFGVKYFTKGVLVVGLCAVEGFGGSFCPAEEAGIQKGDVIISAAGKELDSAKSLQNIISEAGKNAVALEVQRKDDVFTTALYPALSAADNSYKGGMWVRDSTAGIGTVSYICADGKSFGGLGHGICDSDTGALMPLGSAAVVDVDINNVRKGTSGYPGELKGEMGKVRRGYLTANTETGVYGVWETPPKNLGDPLPIGLSDTVKKGKAQIFSTVDGERKSYEIEIEEIDINAEENRNMLIRVTDKGLLEKTGGIVQGMSGSPIVQNGKIIGAVTHVLINDPTRGYGIFIENMLAAN
ncbi:MAG: SpoIVB peptidase [Ruminococcaceae bacterium]|nr:SpoIVB peptidase [Oscillospiraceae bacterium]